MSRSRVVSAPPERVWQLISDPHSLPRWWPRVIRVESVDVRRGGERSQWTKVLGTQAGRGVRADFRCLHSTHGRRWVWEQEIEGTPFEKHLASARTEILLEPAGEGTRVEIRSVQKLRGLSRLGAPLMRGAGRRLIDEALDGVERALAPEPVEPA